MSSFDIETNPRTQDKVYKRILENGLSVYICVKKGYSKKIGMLGTIYGSIDNDFIDSETNKRIKVENGIAHFLEHKLFEQEDGNALDLFAQMGINSNAYTSFDHTVYFFETNKNFEEGLQTLIKLVSTPHFTNDNVEKEKGIIEQELKMYEDNPNAVAFFNVLKGLYSKMPLNVDIIGTIESIYKINKEALYSCYNTFYNPKNMFAIIIGDIDLEDTINLMEKEYKIGIKEKNKDVVRFCKEEPDEIKSKELVKKMDIYTPNICMGFKIGKQDGKTNIKNKLIVDLINEMYFSNISDFYQRLYKAEIINEPIQVDYESGENYAHIIIYISSEKYELCEKEVLKHIDDLIKKGIEKKLLEIAIKKKKGRLIFDSEEIINVHRKIIDSIIERVDIFEEEKIIDNITTDDINQFIIEKFKSEKMCISRVITKQEKS